jgi:CheY-like chemotaxis protein
MIDLKPRLLMVDDDVPVVRVYERAFRDEFIVDRVAGAADALERIAAGVHYDAILCDRNLGGGMSGEAFFRAVAQAVRDRIVMWSGVLPTFDDAFALALGERYFHKAGSLSSLDALVRRVAGVGLAGVAALGFPSAKATTPTRELKAYSVGSKHLYYLLDAGQLVDVKRAAARLHDPDNEDEDTMRELGHRLADIGTVCATREVGDASALVRAQLRAVERTLLVRDADLEAALLELSKMTATNADLRAVIATKARGRT